MRKAALSEWEEVAGCEAVDGTGARYKQLWVKLRDRTGEQSEHFAQVKWSVFPKEMFCKAKTSVSKMGGYY